VEFFLSSGLRALRKSCDEFFIVDFASFLSRELLKQAFSPQPLNSSYRKREEQQESGFIDVFAVRSVSQTAVELGNEAQFFRCD